MEKKISCCGLQSYFVEIRPKKDFKGSLEHISEFFYDMRLPAISQEDSIRICVVGCDLHKMIHDIELSIGQSGYISRVDIGSEIVVYDYLHSL